VNPTSGGAQNSGIVREAPTTSIATILPQSVTTAVGKGTVAVQDKAGKYYLNRENLEGFLP
jgi:protein NEDD1